MAGTNHVVDVAAGIGCRAGVLLDQLSPPRDDEGNRGYDAVAVAAAVDHPTVGITSLIVRNNGRTSADPKGARTVGI